MIGLAAQPAEILAQHLELADVERAADRVDEVLRHVDVVDVLVLEQQLPHAGQVADHVADRREQHAVEAVEAAGQPELDRRARNAADVALVVGVALDHLERVAAAEDADRQHARRVDQLARHVDRHVADRLAPRHGGLPLLDGVEVEVLEQRLAALDDLDDGRQCRPSAVLPVGFALARGRRRGPRWRRACSSAGRDRAARPRQGGDGRRGSSRRAPPRRRSASAAALLPARCWSKYASAAASGSSNTICTRPIAFASSAPIERPENSRSSAAGWLTRYGSSTDAAGANTPSFISGWPNCASGAAKIGPPASATSSPPPRHWPRTATRIGAGNSSIARISACSDASIAAQRSGRCSSTLAPKLKCGPSASSSTPRSPAGPR